MTRRGAVHIIDAFLASLVIATALLSTVQAPLSEVQPETQGLSATSYQTLLSLDENDSLGQLIVDENWSEIEQLLNIFLPTGLSYNLTVIDENGKRVNDRPVTNGGLRGYNIESVEYLLVVETRFCHLYRIRLQVGR